MQAHTLLLSLAVLSPLAGCLESADDTTLLFGLTDADVQRFHDHYVADESVELTRARLTAPFDCALYDDLCRQVGTEAAIAITERQVELGLAGAPLADLEQTLTDGIAEATRAPRSESARTAGDWAFDHDASGNFRLAVRNGITTPVAGLRRGWTEAKMQHQGLFGVWGNIEATRLCVDTGVNTQRKLSVDTQGEPQNELLESFDPPRICDTAAATLTSTTYHARLSGTFDELFTITVNGRADASANGDAFVRTAPVHAYSY